MPRPGSTVVHPRLLSRVRPVSEGAMPDRITFRRPQGEPVVSDDGLTVTYPAGLVRYAGPCRLMPMADTVRVREVAERMVTFRVYKVLLPWAAGPIEVDDVGVVDSSGDPDLPGRRLRVMDAPASSLEVERALLCEEMVD